MEKITFSLIMATYGRKDEVGAFLESILTQEFDIGSIEVIIVDQNDIIELDNIIIMYSSKINIIHLKSQIKGLSYNRNVGLKIARGQIYSFPDDDCTYYPETLKAVKEFFDNNLESSTLLGQIIDMEKDRKVIRNWPDKEVVMNNRNFFMLYSAITIFTKQKDVFFDETLGVGTKFGSYEDADYVLELLNLGKVVYTPNIKVWHPELNTQTMSFVKIKTYSMGFGALCKKHMSIYIFWLFFKAIGFHMLKLCSAVIKLNKVESKKRLYSVVYRVKGFLVY